MVCVFVIVLFFNSALSQLINEEVDHEEIKCLVCQQTVKEITDEILKVSPGRQIEVGGYQIDGNGNKKQKTIPYRRSEMFLTEVLEKICLKMENYVKAKHKETGKIIVMSLVGEGGSMNPLMSEVDIIQDVDLNRNLKLYCEEILEMHDEIFIEHFQKDLDNAVEEICINTTRLCVEEAEVEKDEL